MNLENRIQKMERQFPRGNKNFSRLFLCYYGAEPSEEEREIAIKKDLELHPHQPSTIIHAVPYDFKHELFTNCIRPPRRENWVLVEDRESGTITYGHNLYKLTEQYDKSVAEKWIK